MNFKTLDVGCGFIKNLHRRRRGIGLDLYRGTCDIVGDVQNLPFKDGIFKRILLYDILEHLPHPTRCLKECIRVAKDDALFEIDIPYGWYRGQMNDLKSMILEFPSGVLRAIKGCIRRYKYRKMRGQPHINRIQLKDISCFLKIKRTKIMRGHHTWCDGSWGKIVKKIIGDRKLYSNAWRSQYIEATKKMR